MNNSELFEEFKNDNQGGWHPWKDDVDQLIAYIEELKMEVKDAKNGRAISDGYTEILDSEKEKLIEENTKLKKYLDFQERL